MAEKKEKKVIRKAVKQARQALVRRQNNRHYSSEMKSLIKLLMKHVQAGDMEKATKVLPQVTKAIDMAAKKRLIHRKNADHKKSHVSLAVNALAAKPKKEKPAA